MAPTSALHASDRELKPLYQQNERIGNERPTSMVNEKLDKIDLLDGYLERINAALQKRMRNEHNHSAGMIFETNTHFN